MGLRLGPLGDRGRPGGRHLLQEADRPLGARDGRCELIEQRPVHLCVDSASLPCPEQPRAPRIEGGIRRVVAAVEDVPGEDAQLQGGH